MSDIKEILETEFSDRFVDGMKNRMVVSFFKYGKVADSKGTDRLASLRKRLERYEETGNTEWLIDVANFAMIEFMLPNHVNSHFKGTDSHESPGRVRVDGSTDALPNAPRDSSVARLIERYQRDGD